METVGTDERAATDSVIDRLIASPQGFDLFQAISLLERAVENSVSGERPDDALSGVNLRSVVSLGFQPSDINRVEHSTQPDAPYILHTAAMSLAGANGPLPLSFTEMVIERTAARDHATADFLNIFNNRYLKFLYLGRKKHNMGLNGHAPQTSAIAACLDSLSALGLKAGVRGPGGAVGWLDHAGLMGGAPRSMAGLLALLSDRLGVRATGRQFCGGWRNLESRDVLTLNSRAQGPRLGSTAVLGRRVWDQSAGIRIELRGVKLNRLQRLLQGGDEHALMQWLVRRYLPQDLNVEVELHTRSDEIKPSTLSAQLGLRLGLTSWLTTKPPATVPPTRYKLNDDNFATA